LQKTHALQLSKNAPGAQHFTPLSGIDVRMITGAIVGTGAGVRTSTIFTSTEGGGTAALASFSGTGAVTTATPASSCGVKVSAARPLHPAIVHVNSTIVIICMKSSLFL
jgi:hypothetical protein